jgi:hypothetical protein
MTQVEVSGAAFTARKKDDVHRASSSPFSLDEMTTAMTAFGARLASIFKGLHMAGILVIR